MMFRQLIVVSIFSVYAFSAQAAFVSALTPTQIRAAIAVVPQAASAVTVAVQEVIAVEPAPTLVLPLPLATRTTQTVCSVSCS